MSEVKKKVFKTVADQRRHLVEHNNINDDELISVILSERCYAAIINPYKRAFTKGKSDMGFNYIESVDFSNYIELAALDDYFAQILFKWIGLFERKLKFNIAYTISKYMYADGDVTCTSYIDLMSKFMTEKDYQHLEKMGMIPIEKGYLKTGSLIDFDFLTESRLAMLDNIIDIGSNKKESKNSMIKHYQTKYGEVPFWLIVHTLSFSQLHIIFNMLHRPLQNKIYQGFFPENQKVTSRETFRFSGYLRTIREMRNKASHYEPLFSYFQSKDSYGLEQVESVLRLLSKTNKEAQIVSTNEVDLAKFQENDFNKKYLDVIKKIYLLIESS